MNYKDMNDIKIMGRLTADAETKQVNEKKTVTNFSIACDRNIPAEGENNNTDFFKITAWNQSTAFVGKYLKKGEQVIVSGSLRNNNWNDVEGKKHYECYIEADHIYVPQAKKKNN